MTRIWSPTPRGLRYREATGFELRCLGCADSDQPGDSRWWPLTTEFWFPSRGLSRCRACWREYDARKARQKYLTDLSARDRHLLSSRQYRKLHRSVQRIKNKAKWQSILADPVAHASAKERTREAQRRYRARKKYDALMGQEKAA